MKVLNFLPYMQQNPVTNEAYAIDDDDDNNASR